MRSEECAAVRLQGLELLVTVLLARNRQPPPTVAAGVPHAELAAELISLPSGLLAMVCAAIVKLKVRRGAACACVGVHGRMLGVLRVVTGLDTLQVSDMARARPDSRSTGPLRRSSRLSTLRARASA
jgi:hypothetical protein